MLLSGKGELVLHSWRDEVQGEYLGACVDDFDDVDGDGIVDFIASAPGAQDGIGEVRVYSGARHDVLRRIVGDGIGTGFGYDLTTDADVDRDGFRDLVIGAPLGEGPRGQSGQVWVVSGRDGHTLLVVARGSAGARFGASVSAGRDLDRDGWPDLLVGAPFHSASPTDPPRGAAFVISGKDGALLRSWTGSSDRHRFGDHVELTDDVTGDGVPDVLISASGPSRDEARWKPRGVGYGFLFDGESGDLVRTIADDSYNGAGFRLVGVGDLDGDGAVELAACSPNGFYFAGPSGFVRIVSSRDWKTRPPISVYDFHEDTWFYHLGCSIDVVEDMNGDGTRDLALASDWGVGVACGRTGRPVIEYSGPTIRRLREAELEGNEQDGK